MQLAPDQDGGNPPDRGSNMEVNPPPPRRLLPQITNGLEPKKSHRKLRLTVLTAT